MPRARDRDDAEHADHHEPQREDRSEVASHAAAAAALDREQTDEDRDRQRDHEPVKHRRRDVETLDGRQHRDRGRDHAVAVERTRRTASSTRTRRPMCSRRSRPKRRPRGDHGRMQARPYAAPSGCVHRVSPVLLVLCTRVSVTRLAGKRGVFVAMAFVRNDPCSALARMASGIELRSRCRSSLPAAAAAVARRS
jgi:hypothetical protein